MRALRVPEGSWWRFEDGQPGEGDLHLARVGYPLEGYRPHGAGPGRYAVFTGHLITQQYPLGDMHHLTMVTIRVSEEDWVSDAFWQRPSHESAKTTRSYISPQSV